MTSTQLTDLQHITYEVHERIATITIDSPDNNNAFTPLMGIELVDVLEQADQDNDVKVIVFTGKGRFFCPGADLSGSGANTFDFDTRFADGDALADKIGTIDGIRRDGGGRVALAIAALRKPIIAAVNGAGVGVGSTMLLPCDIRLASDNAKFGFVFAKRGIMPEAASTWFLPRIVGIAQALEWSYTGRVFDADEALRAGLVSQVIPAEGLMDAAYDLAREFTGSSALTMAVSRKMMWNMLSAESPWEAHRLDSKGIYELGRLADAKEGVASFLEKRPAKFSATIPRDYPEWLPDFPGPQPDEPA